MNPCAIATEVIDSDGDNRWISIHNRFVSETREKDPDVIFIGDCLLQALQHSEMWHQFAPLHCLNFSIHEDRTQHVLWRIANGELDNVQPKVVVLQAGNNNVKDEPLHISEGIIEIIKLIRSKHPAAYIVVLPLLPRGQYPNHLRTLVAEVNEFVKSETISMARVQMVSIDWGLVQLDGTISHHDMHDYLLLTNAGFKKAFEPVFDLLTQLLNEGETEKDLTPSE